MIKLLKLVREIDLEKNKWTKLPKSDLDTYEEELFQLISNAYADLGGHPNYRSKSDVKTGADEYSVIDLDDDPDIDAVTAQKVGSPGSKIVATGHDGEKISRSAVLIRLVNTLNSYGNYIEASGKLLDILISKGVSPVTDERVVRKVLKGKDIKWHGDGSYSREIGGNIFRKTMLGNPTVN